MPFLNDNVAVGLPPQGKLQSGITDGDDNRIIEDGIFIPAPTDPAGSYVYYDCAVGVMLDSGIAIHNHLPQVNYPPDTLASVALDDADLDRLTGVGVNLRCRDQYSDIVQRMGHARYWFRIWGQALRVGYQVPIPAIVDIGGVPAVPYDRNPQWAFNRIAPGGNYGGLILWHAVWSLWYTTAVPPVTQTIPAADSAAHISGAAPIPNVVQSPYSQADDDAATGIPIVAK